MATPQKTVTVTFKLIADTLVVKGLVLMLMPRIKLCRTDTSYRNHPPSCPNQRVGVFVNPDCADYGRGGPSVCRCMAQMEIEACSMGDMDVLDNTLVVYDSIGAEGECFKE